MSSYIPIKLRTILNVEADLKMASKIYMLSRPTLGYMIKSTKCIGMAIITLYLYQTLKTQCFAWYNCDWICKNPPGMHKN